MDFSRLLTPEAIATYVVFFLGIILTTFAFFIKRLFDRAKPKIIKLSKISESLLVKIDNEVKKDVHVSFKEEPVNSLYLSIFQISNPSDLELDDIEINIVIKKNKILDLQKNDPLHKRESDFSWHNNIWDEDISTSIILKFPFLNQEKLYRDIVSFKILTQEPIEVENIIGGGRGWKVDYIDRVRLSKELIETISALEIKTNSLQNLLFSISKSSLDILAKLLK